jgi:hypothetical protein
MIFKPDPFQKDVLVQFDSFEAFVQIDDSF